MSCLPFKSLNSTTFIKANDVFILGNNVHGKFYINVTNTSNVEIQIWQYPIDGATFPHKLKTFIKCKGECRQKYLIEN